MALRKGAVANNTERQQYPTPKHLKTGQIQPENGSCSEQTTKDRGQRFGGLEGWLIDRHSVLPCSFISVGASCQLQAWLLLYYGRYRHLGSRQRNRRGTDEYIHGSNPLVELYLGTDLYSQMGVSKR